MKSDSSLFLQKLDEVIFLLKQIMPKSPISENKDSSPPISIQEAAAYLQLSKSRVYTLVYQGKLKTLQNQKHGRMLFSISDLQVYLKGQHKPYGQ